MSSAVRDRSARSRIRDYLTHQGPIQDASGRATSVLKDAVKYNGSSVAFIQLVTAMDKANEIKREIRGKRTYKISAAAVRRAAAPQPARTDDPLLLDESSTDISAIDYDKLAGALLRELARIIAATRLTTEPAEGAEVARVERERLMAERDEYARRLHIARQQLNALLSESVLAVEASGEFADSQDVGRAEWAS